MLRALENPVSFKPIKINRFCFPKRVKLRSGWYSSAPPRRSAFVLVISWDHRPVADVLTADKCFQKCHNIILHVWWCHCKENERLQLSVSVGLTIAMSYMTEILNSQSMKVSSG